MLDHTVGLILVIGSLLVIIGAVIYAAFFQERP